MNQELKNHLESFYGPQLFPDSRKKVKLRNIRPASLPNKESALAWPFVANSVTIFGSSPRHFGLVGNRELGRSMMSTNWIDFTSGVCEHPSAASGRERPN